MPKCGTQVILCDLPVRFDTYKGCTHGCKYCFASKFNDISNVETDETVKALRNWIDGVRSRENAWCDWNIPLHFGGMSDPLQPIEKKVRNTYECLKLLEETQYPFLISTKGKLLGDDEYLEVIGKCNCVVQISAVCGSYDEIEPGAPTFLERIEIGRKVAATGRRLIFRIQPYLPEHFEEIKESLKLMADAGAYGVIIEGMKYSKKRKGLVKVTGDWCIDYKTIKHDFLILKEIGNGLGMKVYAGENRLREYGDSLTCCGIDGLEGFKPNTFNINHLIHGEKVFPSETMCKVGTAACFQSLNQTASMSEVVRKNSFANMMLGYMKKKRKMVSEIFGMAYK